MTASGRRIYLDYNASAPLLPEAREAFVRALDLVGNPSSVHTEGRAARAALTQARAQVAELAGADSETVVFTSGASEAASTCLTPDWQMDGEDVRLPRLAVLETDHPCLREGGRFDPSCLTRLPVGPTGLVDLAALESWAIDGPGLVALTLANSEIGTIQPLEPISQICRTHGVRLVLDAVQMAGRMPLNGLLDHADAMILSGHKIGAPKGVGCLILRSTGFRPQPLVRGGAQETRQRAGTEALPNIVAFGAAAAQAQERVRRAPELERLKRILVERLARIEPNLVVGGAAPALPQTIAIHHPRLRAETVQIALDLQGIAVSAGSACSSGKLGPSHVLSAWKQGGAELDPSAGAIRVSFGLETTEVEIESFAAAFDAIARRSGLGGNPQAA